MKLYAATDRLGALLFNVVFKFPLGHSSSSLLQPDAKLLALFDRHNDAYSNTVGACLLDTSNLLHSGCRLLSAYRHLSRTDYCVTDLLS